MPDTSHNFFSIARLDARSGSSFNCAIDALVFIVKFHPWPSWGLSAQAAVTVPVRSQQHCAQPRMLPTAACRNSVLAVVGAFWPRYLAARAAHMKNQAKAVSIKTVQNQNITFPRHFSSYTSPVRGPKWKFAQVLNRVCCLILSVKICVAVSVILRRVQRACTNCECASIVPNRTAC